MAAKLASARTPTGAVSSSTSPFILQQIGQVKMPTALHIQDEIPASEDKSSLLFPLLSHLLYYIPLSMIPCHCRLTWRLVIILSEPCTICLSYFVSSVKSTLHTHVHALVLIQLSITLIYYLLFLSGRPFKLPVMCRLIQCLCWQLIKRFLLESASSIFDDP